MRKVICYVLSIVMLICLTGCSFSAGDASLKEKNGYKDLFTWGNDTNKFSMKSYVVDLQQYGKVELHVDTSFGHEFELHGETNTFEVKDKDGQTVIDGIFVDQDNYKALSAGYADLKIENINNRDFAVTFDENGQKHLAFTYLADCGMDLGCILASADTDNFKYLAFTGEALEGSSSDIQYYLGKAETAQPELGTTAGEGVETAPAKEADDYDVQFANGKGFNVSKYSVSSESINEYAGSNAYNIITENADAHNLLETGVKQDTDYATAADSLVEVLKSDSGETPILDIHKEGAYITGIYQGFMVLIFVADGTDGFTYVLTLYSDDTENAINIINSIIDDFLASGITEGSARTENGETVENQNSASAGSTEGETVFSTYIIPDGFENMYDGEYNKSYQSDKMEITVNSQPDEEYKRFLDGETDSYYDVYTLKEVASFEAGSHGKVVIAEADNDGIFTYFAGNAGGTVNIKFSQRSYEKISASDCEAFIKQLIK